MSSNQIPFAFRAAAAFLAAPPVVGVSLREAGKQPTEINVHTISAIPAMTLGILLAIAADLSGAAKTSREALPAMPLGEGQGHGMDSYSAGNLLRRRAAHA